MRKCWWFVLLSISFVLGVESGSLQEQTTVVSELYVGGMFVEDDSFRAADISSFLIALQNVNADPTILPNITLTGVIGLDHFSPVIGLENYFEMVKNYDIVGLIGARGSQVSRAIAIAAPLFSTPQISHTSTLPSLSDSNVYPLFSRVVTSDAFLGRAAADLVHHFEWDRIATVSTTDAFAVAVLEEFTTNVVSHKIQFLSSQLFPTISLITDIQDEEVYWSTLRQAVRRIKSSGARVIFLSMITNDGANFFKVAIEEGMLGPPYTYLIGGGISVERVANFMSEEDGAIYNRSTAGFFNFRTKGVVDSELSAEWLEQWVSADPTVYPQVGDPETGFVGSVVQARDAVYALSMALDRVIESGEDPHDGSAVFQSIIQDTDFFGLTGRVFFEPNGDRIWDYWILNGRSKEILEFIPIGTYSIHGITFDLDPIFSDGSTVVPDAAERVYVAWGDVEAIVMVTLSAIGLIVTIVCLVILVIYRSTPILQYSSPRFIVGIGLGVIVGFSNVFAWTGEPSDAQCRARPWMLSWNLILVFGHLYAKALRFLYVMKSRKSLQFTPIPDITLFFCVGLYSLLYVIPCIIWEVAYPLEVERTRNPSNSKVNIECGGEGAEVFLAILLSIGGLSLVFGVVIAFLNRNYNDFFSEASYVGYTLFTICVTCCIVVPMLFLLDDTPDAFYAVYMVGIFLSNGSVVVFLFFSKIRVILFKPEENRVPLDERGSIRTKRDTSSS